MFNRGVREPLSEVTNLFRRYLTGEKDEIRIEPKWKIRRFDDEHALKKDDPYKVSEFKPNLLLNEGITEMLTIIASSSGTKWDNANAYLGVGDGTTAESASQTGLQGTNKFYKRMYTGFPQISGQRVTWMSQFTGTEANFNWREFTVANGNSDSAKNLNRKVSNQGTKASGQIWELTLQMTFS